MRWANHRCNFQGNILLTTFFSFSFLLLPQDFATCQSYLDAGLTKSGYYQVDPDGSGGGASFEIYCDFDSVKNGAIISTVSLPLIFSHICV